MLSPTLANRIKFLSLSAAYKIVQDPVAPNCRDLEVVAPLGEITEPRLGLFGESVDEHESRFPFVTREAHAIPECVEELHRMGSHGDQHQTGIDTQKQHNVERKISINESHAPKANEKQQPPTQDPPLIEKKKEIIPEKPAIAVPPVTEHEKNIEKPLPPPVQENKTTEKPPNETTHGSTVQFARIPSGNLFFSFSPHPEYPDTPFIIDERTSTFDLVKDPQTLERLFSMIDQLKDACELMNINQPRLNTYDVRTKGKVVREGEYWRITKKLKLDW